MAVFVHGSAADVGGDGAGEDRRRRRIGLPAIVAGIGFSGLSGEQIEEALAEAGGAYTDGAELSRVELTPHSHVCALPHPPLRRSAVIFSDAGTGERENSSCSSPEREIFGFGFGFGFRGFSLFLLFCGGRRSGTVEGHLYLDTRFVHGFRMLRLFVVLLTEMPLIMMGWGLVRIKGVFVRW